VTIATAPTLSVVVPVYNEEGNVEPLAAEIGRAVAATGRPYEILFVNDGSRDGTLARLSALARRDPHVRIVDLAGNFGEAAALSAGFATARGEIVVTLDGDGQNNPADIPRLLAALGPGIDVASGRRQLREEPFFSRVLPSRVANGLIARLSGVPVYDCGCGLKAYRRAVVAGARLPRGMNRFLPAILGVDASRVAEVETVDRPRESGRSHYGLSRVIVVLRDLVALPVLVRRPPPGRGVARACAAAASVLAALGIVATIRESVLAAVVLGIAAALALAIRHDVVRFVNAREDGVFRVRRILYGGTSAEDRHRRSGLLGEEPPADVQPPPRRAGYEPVRSRS
jgi:glycosyltransferase involved in cell wall biosynthesis